MIDCTDEQLIEEVRRRGFVIRDAQIGREWVGLTDEEMRSLKQKSIDDRMTRIVSDFEYIRAIEAKLKEKNK